MRYIVRIHKEGNSSSIALPRGLRLEAGVKVGDMLQIWFEDGQIRLLKLDLARMAHEGRVVKVVRDAG